MTYCQENGIVYSHFERWYKKRGSSQDKQPMLVPVEVTDLPKESEAPKQDSPRHPNQDPMWIRSFTIQFRSGLEIRNQNIANSTVSVVFPDNCVIAGSPAKVIKQFGAERKEWICQ